MKEVSVITVTSRTGGMDILFDCLSKQTYGDFELILVDELYEERKVEVKKLARTIGLDVIHIPPSKVSRQFTCASNTNDGLRKANGELVVFLDDYTYLKADAIARHLQGYRDTGGTVLGGIWYVGVEPTQSVDIKGLMSIFNPEVFEQPKNILKEEGRCLPMDYQGQSFYNNNSSLPMDVILQLNGFDENYDGAPGYLDIDMGMRADKIGHKTDMDYDCIGYHYPHRELLKEQWHAQPNKEHLNRLYLRKKFELIQAGVWDLKSPNNRYELSKGGIQ